MDLATASASGGGRTRSRLPPITRTGQAQPGEFVLHVGCRQHSPDRGIARGIVAEPSRPEALEPLDVAAKLRGIAVQHGILDGERHAGGLDPCEALQCRRAALRCDASGRTADCNGAGALLVPGRELQGDRTADGDPRQRDLARDPKLIEQGRDVIGHRIEGEFAAHLLRQSGAAGIIAQHPARFRELWRDIVPAF